MPTLSQIAKGMRISLDTAKHLHRESSFNLRTLPRGLQILYSYHGDRWRLAIRRETVAPSPEEVAVVADAFDVPESAGRHQCLSREQNAVTNRKIVYHVVEFTWREVAAPHPLSQIMATAAPVEGPDRVLAPSSGD